MANLIFTGDIMFGRSFNRKLENLEETNLYKVYGNIFTTLKSVDGLIGNLETTITHSKNKYNKMFNFKIDPKFSQVLKIGNIKYVSLANNHICDYYQEGLLETQNNLDKLNILHSGSGLNYNEVTKPAIMNVKGINIAFFSLADHYPYWKSRKSSNKSNKKSKNSQKKYNNSKKNSLKKSLNKSYKNKKHLDCIWQIDLNNLDDIDDCIRIVKEFKQNNNNIDHIIFSCHVGSNKCDKVEIKIIKFCRKMIDSGVDMIYCHSPHHVLPYEIYNGKYIFYSLGSFIDDYAIDEYRNDLSFLPELHFTKKKITLSKIIYTKISYMTINETVNTNEIDFIKENIDTHNIRKYRFNKFRRLKKNIGGSMNSKKISNKFDEVNNFVFDRTRKFSTNENLVKSLISRCLLPKNKKDIFLKVDRKNFMLNENFNSIKYTDRPSGILSDQTISAPHIHSYAIKHLNDNLKPGNKVLDIGCGSGYLTAIFGYCVGVNNQDKNLRGTVVGIDIYDDIISNCIENIKKENSELFAFPENFKIINSNGWQGYNLNNSKNLNNLNNSNNEEIYDAIHVGARADTLPLPLWKQLKKGGTLIIPLGIEGSTHMQIIKKPEDCLSLGIKDKCVKNKDIGVRFVPLTKS